MTDNQNRSDKEDAMPDPGDAIVIPFSTARRKGAPASSVPAPLPQAAPEALTGALGPLFDAPALPVKPRTRKKATAPRPRSRPTPSHSPEHKRALEITAIYKMTQPVCDDAKAVYAIRTAILSGQWADEDIVAAVQRVADAGFPLTSNSLSYQLRQPGAEREVDPVVHQAVDTALEHLGRLDSEQMTETEKTLASALRSLCVAVMHQAAGAA